MQRQFRSRFPTTRLSWLYFYSAAYGAMQSEGLWRHSLTCGGGGDGERPRSTLAGRLARMFGPNGGQRDMEVEVRFEEEVAPRDYVNILAYSVDGGMRLVGILLPWRVIKVHARLKIGQRRFAHEFFPCLLLLPTLSTSISTGRREVQNKIFFLPFFLSPKWEKTRTRHLRPYRPNTPLPFGLPTLKVFHCCCTHPLYFRGYFNEAHPALFTFVP